MMWIGPRVTVAMGEDLRVLHLARATKRRGIPVNAILAQFVIVNLMLLTATFQAVVNYVQFSLTLCSALTVFGVFVLRWRQPDLATALQVWGYPFTPLVFLAVSGWMLVNCLCNPSTRGPSLLGLVTTTLRACDLFSFAKSRPAETSDHAMKLRLLWLLMLFLATRRLAQKSVTLDETARFLAGLPVKGALAPLMTTPGGRNTRGRWTRRGQKKQAQQIAPIRDWMWPTRSRYFTQHRHHVLHVCRPGLSLRQHFLSLRQDLYPGRTGANRAGAAI